jgi:hypothetical protein
MSSKRGAALVMGAAWPLDVHGHRLEARTYPCALQARSACCVAVGSRCCGCCASRPRSNFRMMESKIGIRTMHAHNKIALPLGTGDAIL